jgi:eukaryotic-like serine/threonine-protein kinase
VGTRGCLDEQAVVAFVGGQMPPPERVSVEDHLDTCSACAELTTWAAAEIAHRSLEPGQVGRPARPGQSGQLGQFGQFGPFGMEARPLIGELPPGSHVERYQILGAVGRGGMGEVYAAYHPDLDRRIALKVVGDAGADSALRRGRLLREARAIARLSHPNVITVYDAGTFGDRVYIAMEFIEGETVDAWLRSQRRSWRQILDVFIAAGRGLAAAHAAGIIHRDFKPENVMVGRDGSVRVMDFGLARLAEEPVDAPADAGDGEGRARARAPLTATTVTKTGALVGTLAYMAPEQFRGEPTDARADQFSFCVALHEAIYGRRPPLRHLTVLPEPAVARAGSGGDPRTPTTTRTASSPAWLRGVVARGLSEDRDHRFASMDVMLAAMVRGQKRVRRRMTGLVGGVLIALLTAGAWRVGAARRVSCAVPADRLAAVWPAGDESSPRRQAVRRAFLASGLPTAEAAWRRVATALDEYTKQWSAMYVGACEATHVRGDQSAEALDLRMRCLDEALDGVRALTEVLARADAAMVGPAATAAVDLPPVKHCADITALRSSVPLPRDEQTASAVADIRRTLRDANALYEVGNERAALTKAREALPRAEATGYKPVVAEVLYLTGYIRSDGLPAEAETLFERALVTAEAANDDLTAAKAAIGLVYATSFALEKRHECQQWASLASGILNRLPPPQRRLHAWLLHDQAGVLMQQHEFDAARPLLEQALALKEEELGTNHPDVVRTIIGLIWTMNELGHPDEGLRLADRNLAILGALDSDSILLAYTLNNRGDSLNGLARYAEAERSYESALRIIRAQLGATSYRASVPLVGIASARLHLGDADGAVAPLEEALVLQQGNDPDALAVADTRFALARALAASGKERQRARMLAASARQTYASEGQAAKQSEAAEWLAGH